MKTKMTSRLLAVLLALLLVLGTVPALAVELPVDQYEVLTDSAVDVYYERLMACTALDEFDSVIAQMTEEQFAIFLEKLPEEKAMLLQAKIEELIALQVELDSDEIVLQAVNFSRVAPFLAPVVGSARTSSMLQTFAAEGDDPEADDNGLKLEKKVDGPDTDGQYTLTLEAWATGEKVTTEVTEAIPTDIILVLDQSGSMNFCMYSGCSDQQCDGKHDIVEYVEVYEGDLNTNQTYYYVNNGSYSPLYYCDGSYGSYLCNGGWFTQKHTFANHRGTQLVPKTSAEDATSGHVQFYAQTNTEKEYDIRKTALKNAVEAFVNTVYVKAAGEDKDINTKDDNVDHRIAVVGFASQRGYGNNTEILSVNGSNSGSVGVAYNSLTPDNYKAALQDVSTAAGQQMVTSAVNALAAEGATRIDLGIDMAKSIFDKNQLGQDEKRNRVVIVFTDGSPTSGNNFETSVANDAISNAKALKDKGVTVYSIGIFGGADGSNPESLPLNEDTGSNRENRFMHLVSSNYPKATSMTSPGSVNANLKDDRSYYLSASDSSTLTNIFQSIAIDIETGGSSTTLDEKTVVKDVISDQFKLPDGTDTSDIKVYTADYIGEDKFADKVLLTNPQTSINGNVVTVTKFDFSENWVGTETTNDEVKYRGKKLIIEIPIVVKSGFLGGNGVYTNGQDSGVYENSSATDPVETFVRPTVDVEIPDVTVVAADKNVYLLGDLSADDLVNGATVMCGDVQIDPDFSNNYGLEDWQNAYVNIKLPAGTAESDLTVDKEYTLTATVSPKTGGNVGEKQGTATGNIYVFKPVLTFKDSTIDYMTVVSDVTAYHNAENYVSVAWKRGTVIADAVTMGPAPSLSLEYTPSNTAWVTDGKVTADSDVNVNVAAKIGIVDVSAYTSAIRKACTYCDHTSDDTEAKILNSKNPEFVVHITNVLSSLTIKKTGLNVGVYSGGVDRESAIVTVTGGGKTWTVALTQDNEFKATLVGLKVGETYTVTEDTGWTWRYVSSNAAQSVTISKDGNNVTINNAISNQYWLGGDNFRVNKFAPYTANTATE